MYKKGHTAAGTVVQIKLFAPEKLQPLVECFEAMPLAFLHLNKVQATQYHLLSIKNCIDKGVLFGYYSQNRLEAIAGISRLDWDSAHYGFECYQLSNIMILPSTVMQPEKLSLLIGELLAYAKSRNTKFISVIAGTYEVHLSNVLQQLKFSYILTWLQGAIAAGKVNPMVSLPEGHEIGLVHEDEIGVYSLMAESQYFEGGRFFMDKHFDRSMVKQMYAQLVKNSYRNNDIMISYRINGESVGLFVSKKIEKQNLDKCVAIAPLRFLVVKPEARKIGVGKALFTYTLEHLSKNSDFITTGLEVHNLPSLNLHSKLNFNFHHTQNVFHWWNN